MAPTRCIIVPLTAVLCAAVSSVSAIGCPYLAGKQSNSENVGGERALLAGYDDSSDYYGGADYSRETYEAIKGDIADMLTDSKDFWPADFGNYGPLLIRLAWHCAGTYRQSDGRGGCDGGRIRYNPERSWADNTNLDKSLTLLQPIKLKWGDAISWADLITLTGNVAIEYMGGPIIGFCAGRLDDDSGYSSLELGPSDEQEAVAPCEVNGTCEFPLGTSTVGLIYVNPGGPLGVPDPAGSVDKIRDVFGRMGMNDSETVALIGGGHAFGKFHGACTTGPGADPIDAPEDPWAGTCGDPDDPLFGKGPNTFTSGFEGQWTVEATLWENEYFKDLLEYDWVIEVSSGGNNQWKPVLKPGSTESEEDIPDIRMLTTDIALLRDPDYLALVELYAENLDALDNSFSNAWYKLTSRDMGPVTRCMGTDVPPVKEFQMPLPESSGTLTSGRVNQLKRALRDVFSTSSDTIDPDTYNGESSYSALFVYLAYQCMDSFRSTDYFGGCNGARIRFPPQSEWEDNIDMDLVISLLEPVKDEYPDATYADLIVLAGYTALEEGADIDLHYCSGRVDADEGTDDQSMLEPLDYDDVIVGVRDRMKIVGLTPRQMVALAGRPRSPTQMVRLGYSGSYTEDYKTLSNQFYITLLTETWEEVSDSDGAEYRAVGKTGVYALATDLALVWDAEFKAVAQEYASDNDLFLKEFANAWFAYFAADRFDGNTENECIRS